MAQDKDHRLPVRAGGGTLRSCLNFISSLVEKDLK